MSSRSDLLESGPDRDLEMVICRNLSIVQGYDGTMTDEEIMSAWKYLIETGAAAQCEGWVAQTADRLIEEGIIEINE